VEIARLSNGCSGRKALARVREVFSGRPLPVGVDYCHHCLSEEEMAELLRTPYEQLTPEQLEHPVLWNAYWTWGDWPSLAYYVPRLLEFYIANQLDEEMLFYKLVLAARPELFDRPAGSPPVMDAIGETMRAEERRSLFDLVQAVLEMRLQHLDLAAGCRQEPSDPVSVPATVAFLAALDAPIAPFLERWTRSDTLAARLHLCLLMGHHLLDDGSGQRALGNSYLDRMEPLPENQTALDELLSPAVIADYLVEHLGIWPDTLEELHAAFHRACHEASLRD
jgi:hypothetical protein